jgi:hypothetical protein
VFSDEKHRTCSSPRQSVPGELALSRIASPDCPVVTATVQELMVVEYDSAKASCTQSQCSRCTLCTCIYSLTQSSLTAWGLESKGGRCVTDGMVEKLQYMHASQRDLPVNSYHCSHPRCNIMLYDRLPCPARYPQQTRR